MKNLILTTFILFISITMNSQISDRPLISTRGSATVYAIPNEALMSFSIVTFSNDISEAKNKNSKISIETVDYLKKKGIEEKHIQTQYLNVGKNYRHDRDPGRELKYQATQSFSVCVADLKELESIMSDLLTMDISNLGSPVFRTTKIKMYMEEARNEAILNARQKAVGLAKQLEQNVGKAHRISEVNFDRGGRVAYANFAEDAGRSVGPPQDSFAIGQLEIKAEIDVSFNLD